MPVFWKQEFTGDLERFNLDLHVWGPATHDAPIEIFLAEWARQDLSLEVSAFYQSWGDDVTTDIYAAQEVRDDLTLDIFFGPQAKEDFVIDFFLSRLELPDFLLDIAVSDGEILKDTMLDIDVNDGTSLNDFMIDIRLISKKPTFKMAYGLGLTSVIKEV
jgi:hypothetical protein